MTKWVDLLTASGATLDPTTRLYRYPNLTENYHIGLAKLLADQMLVHHTGLTETGRRELALHPVSLRALIIKNQQRTSPTRLAGWTTHVDLNLNPGTLMNIESLAVNALALGAGAKQVYSPGQAPLQTPAASNYTRTSEGLLKAPLRAPTTASPGSRKRFTVTSADNSLEFRVWRYGGSPFEVAEIRIR